MPRRITDFVRRARSQIKFSRDAGQRTIIKSKFARNRRSVEKHLTNRNGVCRGIFCAKKRPPGASVKKVAGRRKPCARAPMQRGMNICIFMWRRPLSPLVEIAGSTSRDSRKSNPHRFSPVVRKTRMVILNSLGDSGHDSSNTKQAWRSARRKTIYRRLQASLCENPRSKSLSELNLTRRSIARPGSSIYQSMERKVHCDC